MVVCRIGPEDRGRECEGRLGGFGWGIGSLQEIRGVELGQGRELRVVGSDKAGQDDIRPQTARGAAW